MGGAPAHPGYGSRVLRGHARMAQVHKAVCASWGRQRPATHTQSQTQTHTHTHTHTVQTQSHTHSLSLSHTHTHSFSDSLSHTHSHTQVTRHATEPSHSTTPPAPVKQVLTISPTTHQCTPTHCHMDVDMADARPVCFFSLFFCVTGERLGSPLVLDAAGTDLYFNVLSDSQHISFK